MHGRKHFFIGELQHGGCTPLHALCGRGARTNPSWRHWAADFFPYLWTCFCRYCRRSFHDAGTYDPKTRTGGPTGCIRSELMYTQACNAGLKIGVDLLGEKPLLSGLRSGEGCRPLTLSCLQLS